MNKLKTLTSFFRFYYFMIKRDERKFKLVRTHHEFMSAVLTPVFLLLLSFIIGVTTSIGTEYALLLLLYILIIPGNFFILMSTVYKAQYIERQRADEARRRAWEETFKRILWEAEQQQYRNQHQQTIPKVDNNLKNAMKLMNLQEGFTQKDVRSAYRKLSKIHHPDVGGTETNFKRLQKAYNYLMERL